jgi:hypothetical protein
MQNPGVNLRLYALKLFLTLVVASILFQTVIGVYYARGLLPLIKVHLSWMYSDRRVLSFKLTEQGGEEAVIASSIITRSSPKGITQEISTEAGMYIRTFYIAPILVYSLFLTWPWVSVRKRLYGFLWPTLLLAAAQSFFIALMLGSRIALSAGISKGSLDGIIYNGMASGGIHFVAVIIFLLSIAPFHLHFLAPSAMIVGPNEPCPCGSGKKFKTCCGR